MAKTLELTFASAAGKEVTFSVEEPREGLTAAEVKEGMDSLIAQAIFEVEGSPFASTAGARIVERNVEDYEL